MEFNEGPNPGYNVSHLNLAFQMLVLPSSHVYLMTLLNSLKCEIDGNDISTGYMIDKLIYIDV